MGMQMILWHDLVSGRVVRWSVAMKGSAGGVDIALQMKQTLAHADEDYSDD